MDLLPHHPDSFIPKQDLWHQRHVFASPSTSIPHPYSTRYSTTHSLGIPFPPTAHFRTDQPSGSARNFSTLRAEQTAQAAPSHPSTYYAHYPQPAEAETAPASYSRTDRLPAVTFPSPIVTADAYHNDDLKHRPSAYTVANRYAFAAAAPSSSATRSVSHTDFIGTRPLSAPSHYVARDQRNGFTRNNAHKQPFFVFDQSEGGYGTEYGEHLDLSARLAAEQQRQRQRRGEEEKEALAAVPSGFTRAMSPPPAEGIGTEHSKLRVFSSDEKVRKEQLVIGATGAAAAAAGMGSLQRDWELARIQRQEPLTAQWLQDGSRRYVTTGAFLGRTAEEAKTTTGAGEQTDSSAPSLANGGMTGLYMSTARRHFSNTATLRSSASPAVQSVRDSGFTHNAHPVPPASSPSLPLPLSSSTGRMRAGAGRLSSRYLASDGVLAHSLYPHPDSLAHPFPSRSAVDTSRVQSAYSREEQPGAWETERRQRWYADKADGSGKDWSSGGRLVERYDSRHPTVRRMEEVQQAEPQPDIKNYGAHLDTRDRDWCPDDDVTQRVRQQRST